MDKDKIDSLKTEKRYSYLYENAYRFTRSEAAEAFAGLIAEDVKNRPQIYSQKAIILEGSSSPIEYCIGSLICQFQRIDSAPKIQRDSEATNGGIRFNLDNFVLGYVEVSVSRERNLREYIENYFKSNFPSLLKSV